MMTGWWNWGGWPRAEEWSAWWAFCTLVVAVLAAGAALAQLRAYLREQEERSRPYLVVDFGFRSVLLYVTLENISATPATNVSMTARPMFGSTMGNAVGDLERVFGGDMVIAQVAPKRVMRWLVDRTPDLFEREDLPHRFEVTVQYTDARPRIGRTYSEVFVLDLDAFGDASGESDHENEMWNIAKRNEQRLEKMKDSLVSLASTLDTVLGIDEAAKAQRRRAPMLARRRRRQQESHSPRAR